jgi:hypothetical protein
VRNAPHDEKAERRRLSVVFPPLDFGAVRAVIAHIDSDGEAGIDSQAFIELGLAAFVEQFVAVTRAGTRPTCGSRSRPRHAHAHCLDLLRGLAGPLWPGPIGKHSSTIRIFFGRESRASFPTDVLNDLVSSPDFLAHRDPPHVARKCLLIFSLGGLTDSDGKHVARHRDAHGVTSPRAAHSSFWCESMSILRAFEIDCRLLDARNEFTKSGGCPS